MFFLRVIIAIVLLFGFAFGSIGKILITKGDVKILRNGATLDAKVGFKIEEKDNIVSKNLSSIQIIFDDGTVITLGANTDFSVKEYLYTEKNNNSKTTMSVGQGVFRAITGQIGKLNPDNFKLQTKSSSIGIRGTNFRGVVPPVADVPEKIACTQGSITVTPLSFDAKPVVVPAGFMILITQAKMEAPKPYTKSELQELDKPIETKEQTKKDEPLATQKTESSEQKEEPHAKQEEKTQTNDDSKNTLNQETKKEEKQLENSNIQNQQETKETLKTENVTPIGDNQEVVVQSVQPISVNTETVIPNIAEQVAEITKKVVDETPPSIPTLTLDNTLTNDNTPTITGITEAGAIVTIKNGTAILGTATADNNGNWSFTPTSSLSDGSYNLSAFASDASGNISSASNVTTIVVDTVSMVPTLNTPVIVQNAVSDRYVVSIGGMAEAGSIVSITYNGTTIQVTTDNTGHWSADNLPITTTSLIITAVAQDSVGNISQVFNSTPYEIGTNIQIDYPATVLYAKSNNNLQMLVNLTATATSADDVITAKNAAIEILNNAQTAANMTYISAGLEISMSASSDLLEIRSKANQVFNNLINTALNNNDFTQLVTYMNTGGTTVSNSINNLLSTVVIPDAITAKNLARLSAAYQTTGSDTASATLRTQALTAMNTIVSTAGTNRDFATINTALSISSVSTEAQTALTNALNAAATGGNFGNFQTALGITGNVHDQAKTRLETLISTTWDSAISGVGLFNTINAALGYASTEEVYTVTKNYLINSKVPTTDFVQLKKAYLSITDSTIKTTISSRQNTIISGASANDVKLMAQGLLTSSTYQIADDKLPNTQVAGTTYNIISVGGGTDFASNALKVTCNGTTKYFKTSANTTTYGTDITFTSLSDLVTKLQAFVDANSGNGLVFSLNANTGQISFSSSTGATLPIVSIQKVNNTEFLGFPSYSSVGTVGATAGSMSVARREFAMANYGSTVLAIGGYGASVLNSVEQYNPSSQTWSSISTPASWSTQGRFALAAATLSGGSVLVVGGLGSTYTNTVDLYDGTSWTAKTAMPRYIAGHRAVGLPNNKALVVGGNSGSTTSNQAYTSEVWLFDLAGNSGAGSWTQLTNSNIGNMNMPEAVALSGSYAGKVLIMGGALGSSAAEIYDTSGTGSNASAASMLMPKAAFSSTLLKDGTVLVLGGESSFGENFLKTIEQYTPDYSGGLGSWKYKVPLPFTFAFGRAVTLDDGSVLLAGGKQGGTTSASSYIYTPTAERDYPTNNAAIASLTGGTIFLAGAYNDTVNPAIHYVQTYDPTTKIWTNRYNSTTAFAGSAVELNNGKVLISRETNFYIFDTSTATYAAPYTGTRSDYALAAPLAKVSSGDVYSFGAYFGGSSISNQILKFTYDSSASSAGYGVWNKLTETLPIALMGASAVTLTGSYADKILIFGGFTVANGSPTKNAYLFNPSDNTFDNTISQMLLPRALHSGVLSNGKVLAIGGQTTDGSALSSVEEYNPATNQWVYKVPLPVTIRNGSAATLTDGTVLITGGYQGGSWTTNTMIYNPNQSLSSGTTAFDSPLFSNAIKLTLGSATTYFKYSGNGTDYRTDGTGDEQTFSSFSELVTKLNSAANSSGVYFYLDPATNKIVYGSTGATTVAIDKVVAGSEFLGFSDTGATNYTTATDDTMSLARFRPAMTALGDGRVFVYGGCTTDDCANSIVLNTSEIYNNSSWGTVTHNENAPTLGIGAKAIALSNSSVLVAGGYNGSNQYATWLWNESSGWSQKGDLSIFHASDTSHTYGLDPTNFVMAKSSNSIYSIANNFIQKYNVSTGKWSDFSNSTPYTLYGHSGLTLSGSFADKILVFGGTGYNSSDATNTYLLDPTSGSAVWTKKATMLTASSFGSSTLLKDGNVLVAGGVQSKAVQTYNPSLDMWSYKVPLPFIFEYGSAATLTDGSVLLVGAKLPDNTFTENTYIYNPVQSLTSTINTILAADANAGLNDGFFIGSKSDMTSRLVGTITKMLFNADLSTVSTTLGELAGANISGSANTLWSTYEAANKLTFGNYTSLASGVSTYVNNSGEDNKIIWGGATVDSSAGTIGFASLPDKVNADNSLQNVDDYSSWGYWEAMSTDSTKYNSGYWVSGQPTPVAYIQQMINQNQTYNYSGHVLGDTLNASNVKDAIVLDSSNKINMTIKFGQVNPINVTALSFKTSQGWSYDKSSGFTGTSAIPANSNTYTASITNTGDALNLQGKFYGPAANSTGGVIAGTLTGTVGNATATARDIQGVFKASR